MSYLGFHLAFNLPLLLVLFFLSGKGFWPGEMVLVMVGVLGIVVAFTSPWDNWAVAKGIWDFPPERVRFRIGRLPVEEYAFFVIQSVEVMLLSWIFLRWMAPPQSAPPPCWIGDPQVMRQLCFLLVIWVGFGVALKEWPRRDRRIHYAWHLFFWFIPVVLIQWIVAG
ncbi:MAG: lycopene cyclase domain-containing protein, partial [Verrucomicrobia bacterium]|nr:lycopene cyclase domain-containing protein [Verrucomicrobiota bacterium]